MILDRTLDGVALAEVGVAAAEWVEVADREGAGLPAPAAAARDNEHREHHAEQPECEPPHDLLLLTWRLIQPGGI